MLNLKTVNRNGQSQPHFNFEGEKPEYCSKCKKPGMIHLDYKKRKSTLDQTNNSKKEKLLILFKLKENLMKLFIKKILI